jgi:hypothetical protein
MHIYIYMFLNKDKRTPHILAITQHCWQHCTTDFAVSNITKFIFLHKHGKKYLLVF